ncbi:hypothetical protein [Calothrix sp. 336/3]|uniref:hypothetical protein n=1 Tax=Calothrix sp. 336/3 TaxID=1337936 RepID=UPI001EDDDCBC|nr:hypothetical protein [Calothrix sp. 336/3]
MALLASGYAAYEVFMLRQAMTTLQLERNAAPTSSNPTPTTTTTAIATNSPTETAATPTPDASPTTNTGIQPGEFVQPAFGGKAQVELLSVKRIKDPKTGNRDVVNVQMRIRRVAKDDVETGGIYTYDTKARNPDTSETYERVDTSRATGQVDVSNLRPQASADGYVWLRIPEEVKTIDIFVPQTAAFKNVSISS